MTSRQSLELLAKEYPDADAVSAEIINLRAICCLPKGTEYFFSDIHGEADAFSYLVGTASGVIRNRIETLFSNSLPEEERLLLARLIYRPEEVIAQMSDRGGEWCRITIFRLVQVCKSVTSKYTRSKVRKKMPNHFAYVMDELLHADTEENKEDYYTAIIAAIDETGIAGKFIVALCRLIRTCSINMLHILGDIFDRGPHADLVMDELMMFSNVDVQWGNHDVHWMGAASGNEVCVANVVRIAISYNNFDLLEDSYGINLRPLSTFAAEVYGNDPCLPFQPHLLDTNIYDPIDAQLAAKMHKAIAIIQFKLEGQLIARRPEYQMENRSLLKTVDFAKGEITLNGDTHPLRDVLFPTVDPDDPLRLTEGEAELVHTLTHSFTRSPTLQRHLRFLYNNGSIYKIYNGNLLFHGCIPTDEDGSFKRVQLGGKELYGKAYMDEIDRIIRSAYYAPIDSVERHKAGDFMWYLWCGAKSPVFGKNRLTTFERYFVEDKSTHAEKQNPYYHYIDQPPFCESLLREFGLDPAEAHIVNGHVPVKAGESPTKAGGLLFIIDGGISKAYHSTTGSGGYTLISNSHTLSLAEHRPFEEVLEADFSLLPTVTIVKQYPRRVTVQNTDIGKMLLERIALLEQLLKAYRDGKMREQQTAGLD